MEFILFAVFLCFGYIFAGQQEVFHHTECKRDYVKIGCINNQDNMFKDVVATTLKDHSKYIGQGADWNNFNQHLHSLACICHERASKSGYKYFAIGNYEICYGSKNVEAFTKIIADKSQASDQCLSGHWYTECLIKEVDECSGEADSLFVYEMRNAIPTQPAPVNGGYTDWSDWTPCDRTCGNGHQQRERTCTNPTPSHNGKDCSVLGESTEIKTCQLSECGTQVSKGKFLRTIVTVDKSYSFSLDIKLMGVRSGWTNIIHAMTSGGKCCGIGKRIPAIFVYNNSPRLHICSSIDENGNHYFDQDIPMGEFTHVEVRQALHHDSKYHYSILFNGKLVYSTINNNPKVFKNVEIYASNSFYNPSNAVIRNVKFESPIAPEYHEVARSKLIQTIPKIEKTYMFSVNIKPTGTVNGWSNIIRITSNNLDCCGIGSRIPALFLYSHTTRLHVTNSVNNNGNFYIDHDIPKDEFTNVKVKQTVDDAGIYHYSIHINDKEIKSVVNQHPRTYENAQVLVGDNFYNPSKAIIEGFEFQSPLENPVYKVTRNEYIRVIPLISKSYRFSLDIKPLGLVSGWSNVFRVNSGTRNCCSPGNRIPALFFYHRSTKLHVCSYINNRGNHYFNKDIPMGKFTNVRIQQILEEDGLYHYSVLYDGEEVYTIINKTPTEFKNAKVFIGDRFYPAANAVVQNVNFVNL